MTFKIHDDVTVRPGAFARRARVTPGDVGQVAGLTDGFAAVDFGGMDTLAVPLAELRHVEPLMTRGETAMRELTLLQRAARAYVEYTFHEHPYSATSGHRLKRTKTQRERGREEGVLATLQELVGEAIGETGYALERIIRERAVEEGLLVHEPEAVPSYRLPTTYEQAAFRKVQEKA